MTQSPTLADSTPPPRSGKQIVALVISWMVVGVPAGWGVAQTVRKSIPLFTAPVATHSATTPSAAGTAR